MRTLVILLMFAKRSATNRNNIGDNNNQHNRCITCLLTPFQLFKWQNLRLANASFLCAPVFLHFLSNNRSKQTMWT